MVNIRISVCLGYSLHSAAEGKEALVGEETVHGGIRLTTLTHETSEGNDISLAGHLTVFVNLEKQNHQVRIIIIGEKSV